MARRKFRATRRSADQSDAAIGTIKQTVALLTASLSPFLLCYVYEETLTR